MTGTNPWAPLLEPVTVGSLRLRNRIVASAHHPLYSDRGRLTDQYIAYFAERARGGAGLVITGSAAVHPSGGTPRHVALWLDTAVSDHARLADAVHRHGGHVFAQLWHNGPQNSGAEDLDNWAAALSSSGVPSPAVGRSPRPMEESDFREMTAAFGVAAAKMQEAGIDGVEISGAHGYLVHSFLSPTMNDRSDAYGGAPADRTRFAAEIIESIRRTCGPDFPVGLRMVFDEYVGPAGVEPAYAAESLRSLVDRAPLDYLSISAGSYFTFERQVPPASVGQDAPLRGHGVLARSVLPPEVPVMLAGAVRTPEVARALVTGGEADLVAMTRAQIADPMLVTKLRESRRDEVRHCVGANQGCLQRLALGREMSCTVNPAAGRELRWSDPTPAEVARRVVVVGGGPAGLKAAEIAALRGHEVILLERAHRLGGMLNTISAVGPQRLWGQMGDDLAAAVVRAGVTVKVGVTADAELVMSHRPDAVVIATGARSTIDGKLFRVPGHPGIATEGQTQVMSLEQAIAQRDSVGRTVLIADDHGDVSVLGLAEDLARSGRQVTLVSSGGTGAAAALTLDAPFLVPRLVDAGVDLVPGSWPRVVAAGGVGLGATGGDRVTRRVRAETVIVHAGRHAAVEGHWAALEGVEQHRIGDCVAARDVDDAVVDGMTTGWKL